MTKRQTMTGACHCGSVRFTVTFSESVTGVNAGDFTLTTSGVSGASISNVSGSGSVYTVTVNTGSGDGTIRLNVLDDDSINDVASNNLGVGFTTGETYTIDKTVPTVVSVVRADASPTNATLPPKRSTSAIDRILGMAWPRLGPSSTAAGSSLR